MTDQLPEVSVACEPVPKTLGQEGHGEGVEYGDRSFYYRVGKHIPKDRVAHVTWEGNYLGRVRGEKEYLILAWNGNSFNVLEKLEWGLREALRPYQGLSPAKAIEFTNEKIAAGKARWEHLPKCEQCSESYLILDDNHPEGLCKKCWKEDTNNDSPKS